MVIIGVVITMLLFLSPVFYPVSVLSGSLHTIAWLNPLTLPIEQARAAIVLNQPPEFIPLLIYSAVAIVIAMLGRMWFNRTERGFADVI